MTIDWAALGSVFVISLAAVAVLTSLFAVGVRGLSARMVAKETGGTGSAGLAAAVVCFAICAVVVLYGLYLIVAA